MFIDPIPNMLGTIQDKARNFFSLPYLDLTKFHTYSILEILINSSDIAVISSILAVISWVAAACS